MSLSSSNKDDAEVISVFHEHQKSERSSTSLKKKKTKRKEVMVLPEKEEFTLTLVKGQKGLGITVAGYVCEKGMSDCMIHDDDAGSVSGMLGTSMSRGPVRNIRQERDRRKHRRPQWQDQDQRPDHRGTNVTEMHVHLQLTALFLSPG